MTSSKRVTSPRITGAPTGTLPNAGAPGSMSMPTTVSPRATSRRMSRGPMKPVAPITRIDIRLHSRGDRLGARLGAARRDHVLAEHLDRAHRALVRDGLRLHDPDHLVYARLLASTHPTGSATR